MGKSDKKNASLNSYFFNDVTLESIFLLRCKAKILIPFNLIDEPIFF